MGKRKIVNIFTSAYVKIKHGRIKHILSIIHPSTQASVPPPVCSAQHMPVRLRACARAATRLLLRSRRVLQLLSYETIEGYMGINSPSGSLGGISTAPRSTQYEFA